jgi:hypothetical protein
MVGLLVAAIIDEEVDRQVILGARCDRYVQPTISSKLMLLRTVSFKDSFKILFAGNFFRSISLFAPISNA